MLVVWLKKQIITQKLVKLKKKITNSNHNKYITTPEFNKLTAETFAAKLRQENSVTKTDFHDNPKNLNKKIISNKTKHVVVENEWKKLETFDSIYFRGESHFKDDANQNYLVFQTAYKYFKTVSNNDADILS